MRSIGSLHPTEGIPYSPDVVGVVIGSSVGAVVPNDYPSAAVATASSRPHIMRMTAEVPFYFLDGSTGYSMAFPSSGIVTVEFFRKGA